MKYFTKEWWSGADDPSAVKSYWAYIGTIRSKLPQDLARLLEEISLHDSRVESLTIKPEAGSALLILNGSSDPWGRSKSGDRPRRITLEYTGLTNVTMRNGDGGAVTALDDSDLGYHEIELLQDDLFQHRMLFDSDVELHLTFKSFRVQIKDEDVPNEASQAIASRGRAAQPER